MGLYDKRFVVLLLAILVLAAFFTLVKVDEERMFSCSVDSDCAAVTADCCGCNMGGKATSINKNYESAWKDKILSQCGERACLAVISNDPTCFAKPECVAGLCKLA